VIGGNDEERGGGIEVEEGGGGEDKEEGGEEGGEEEDNDDEDEADNGKVEERILAEDEISEQGEKRFNSLPPYSCNRRDRTLSTYLPNVDPPE
jgi:hypothetical protein